VHFPYGKGEKEREGGTHLLCRESHVLIQPIWKGVISLARGGEEEGEPRPSAWTKRGGHLPIGGGKFFDEREGKNLEKDRGDLFSVERIARKKEKSLRLASSPVLYLGYGRGIIRRKGKRSQLW